MTTTHEDDVSVHEFETEPFTADELTAIAEYREATAGIPDSFDCFDLAHVQWHVSELGRDQTYAMLRSQAAGLDVWHLALDSALGSLLTCTEESTSYSTAARRFLTAEADTYHRTRQDFEHTGISPPCSPEQNDTQSSPFHISRNGKKSSRERFSFLAKTIFA